MQKTKKICAMYGEGAVTDQMCQKSFAKFCAEDFLLDDAPWSGRQQKSIAIKSRHWEQSTSYHMGDDTLNIQIDKVIGENLKCLLYYGKTYGLLG